VARPESSKGVLAPHALRRLGACHPPTYYFEVVGILNFVSHHSALILHSAYFRFSFTPSTLSESTTPPIYDSLVPEVNSDWLQWIDGKRSFP